MTPDSRPSELPGARGDRGWKAYALALAGLLMAILVLQNLQEVEVRFLFINTEMPLIFALLIVGALGALVGWAAPRVRRGGP
ncbi:MAG: LapA family protein [Actinomycetota bacterium]|nr:LapA family protein [Actinomycetota bacterium]